MTHTDSATAASQGWELAGWGSRRAGRWLGGGRVVGTAVHGDSGFDKDSRNGENTSRVQTQAPLRVAPGFSHLPSRAP